MRTEVPLLSKSDYLAGLKCSKRLYLKKYHRDLESPPDVAGASRMADGQEIGAMARMLFPGGILIDCQGQDAIQLTRAQFSLGVTLFEAQFISAGRTARVDILQNLGDSWRVIEVKSSKQPKEGEQCKEEHLLDIAFQVLVLREAGVNVSSAALMLLSRNYVAPPGEVDPHALFSIVDVTSEVEKLLTEAQFNSIRLLGILQLEQPPVIETNTHCAGCSFHSVCHVEQPKDDIVNLPRVKASQVSELRKQGILRIGDIPKDYKLSSTQVRVRDVHKSGKDYVDSKLGGMIAAAQYPIHFIDFETTSWAIPVLEGTTPYQPIPFQWSCHVMSDRGGEVDHFQYLHATSDDPRPKFSQTLWDLCKDAGSIFVYSSYEMTTLRGLSRCDVPHGELLCELLAARGIDLLKIVQDCVYMSQFGGSFSIKKVLPAMVPSLNYDDLQIREGGAASVEFKRMVAKTTPSPVSEEIGRNLLAYCKRDTLAMVELFNAMWRLCGMGGTELTEDETPIPDDTKQEQLILNI